MENYKDLALAALGRYSVRHFFMSFRYRQGISLSSRAKLTKEVIHSLRDQLKQQNAEYMFDGFLMDLALSPATSKEEKTGLIQLMHIEDEIACGLKALERRGEFELADIHELVNEKNLSKRARSLYQLPLQ